MSASHTISEIFSIK